MHCEVVFHVVRLLNDFVAAVVDASEEVCVFLSILIQHSVDHVPVLRHVFETL